MTSDDPELKEKAADIIGLYLKPPLHAVDFCVDEKLPFKREIHLQESGIPAKPADLCVTYGNLDRPFSPPGAKPVKFRFLIS
jgi:hypothetical protein